MRSIVCSCRSASLRPFQRENFVVSAIALKPIDSASYKSLLTSFVLSVTVADDFRRSWRYTAAPHRREIGMSHKLLSPGSLGCVFLVASQFLFADTPLSASPDLSPAGITANAITIATSCQLDSGHMPLPVADHTPPALAHDDIRLANWNMKKSSESGWRTDLAMLTQGADLVLLQEATLERPVRDGDIADHYGVFAMGYSSGALTSGVLTLSRVPAMSTCALEHVEPWLRTPKATAISLYPLDNGQFLLVVNLHGVNFSLSANPLQQQLADISEHIQRHSGPVVLAGDFNTWNGARFSELEAIRDASGLKSVTFEEDYRIRVLDRALDHVLVRGLEVVSSQTLNTPSSDHNGILVSLSASGIPRDVSGDVEVAP